MTIQSDYTKSDSKRKIEGVPMSGKLVRQQAINGLMTYIYKYVGKISKQVQKEDFGFSDKDLRDDLYGNMPFNDQIEDLLKFDADKWTDYDNTVASMIAVLGVTPVRGEKRKRENSGTELNLGSLITTYKL
jgi:hypothetical protein